MKLLVFGQTGQVATALARLAGPGLAVQTLGRAQADLSRPEDCAAQIARTRADVIINAAAYTNVDGAETHEALAHTINALAPGAMARAAAQRDLPFLHLSTDYVFNGTENRPLTEDAPTAPLNAYGRTKLHGEHAVRAAGGRHLILRTSWVFSETGRNFVTSMLRAAAVRDRLTVVNDQHGGPTPASDIAQALIGISRAVLAGKGVAEVVHYCGRPATTWYGFAREIFAAAGPYTAPSIVPIPSSAWPTQALRPAKTVLDCQRIKDLYGISPPDWRAALPGVIRRLQGEPARAAT